MKNRYLVIDCEGKVVDPVEYLKQAECSEIMKVAIEREVLGQLPNEKLNGGKPEYIEKANKLGFRWEDNSAQGFLQYDYKAQFILNAVKEYSRFLVNRIGMPIYEVSGSNFFDMKHPVVEAYAGLFGDRLFQFKDEQSSLVMSYDASYPQFNLAKKYNLKRANLPFGHFSVSDCYRYEKSGECMLLFRGRRFNMPDLHPYFADLNQAWEGYFKIEKQIEAGFAIAGRKYINVAKVSSEENWGRFQSKLIEIALNGKKELLVEIKQDGEERYWIVDIDYSILDAIGQIREIGCIQIDIGNASRLGIEYVDSDGELKNPVIIHAAVPGGIERYIYMLLDSFENFPVYFAPIQLRLVPVSQKFVPFCIELAERFPNIRIDIDDRAEIVSRKVMQSKKDLVPNVFVIGEKEMQEGGLSELEAAVAEIAGNAAGLPNLYFSFNKLLSEQIRVG